MEHMTIVYHYGNIIHLYTHQCKMGGSVFILGSIVEAMMYTIA